MLVDVHGGPASVVRAAWPRPGLPLQLFSEQGYFVFMPNPRGSYGQGEKFTRANVKDFGHGDLDDILAGVDAVVKNYPVDDKRVGIARLELRRLYDHVGRHADASFPRGVRGRGHRELAKLLRRERDRSVDDSVFRRVGV